MNIQQFDQAWSDACRLLDFSIDENEKINLLPDEAFAVAYTLSSITRMYLQMRLVGVITCPCELPEVHNKGMITSVTKLTDAVSLNRGVSFNSEESRDLVDYSDFFNSHVVVVLLRNNPEFREQYISYLQETGEDGS